jgi:Right handed beta helix region
MPGTGGTVGATDGPSDLGPDGNGGIAGVGGRGTGGSGGGAGSGGGGGTGGTGGGGRSGSGGGGSGGASGSGATPDAAPDVTRDVADGPGTCRTDNECPSDAGQLTCQVGMCGPCTRDFCATMRPNTPVCETSSGRCQICVAPAEGCSSTPTKPKCMMNTCVSCNAGVTPALANTFCRSSFPGQNFCSADGSCVECLISTDCPPAPVATNPICAANKCAGCQSDDQCQQKTNGLFPACDTLHGACVGCTADRHCNRDVTRPICDVAAGNCVPCASDAQCIAKLGGAHSPGICMSHQNGRCATDAETIYVEKRVGCPPGGTGSFLDPFCQTSEAIAVALTAVPPRRLIVLRGVGPHLAFAARITGAEVSVIGESGAGATIAPGAAVGIRLTLGELYLRNITVRGGLDVGIIAEGGSSIRINGCTIMENKGGLLVNGAGFDIRNTVIANNLLTTVPNSIPPNIGYAGVFLRLAPQRTASFQYNTIVNNEQVGLSCAEDYHPRGLLVFNNLPSDLSGCIPTPASSSVVGLDPKFDPERQFHLTAASPCLNKGIASDPVFDDIDGESRPQGMGRDCGADEFEE